MVIIKIFFTYSFILNAMWLMNGSSLPQVVCMRAHVIFTIFVFVCICGVKHILC